MLAERLVANLLDNADRYNTAAGDIWISTRSVGGNSQLIVANTGTLISPADADRIFEPSGGSTNAPPTTASDSASRSSRPSPHSTAALPAPIPAMTAAYPSPSPFQALRDLL